MPRAQLRRTTHHRVATQGLIGAFTLIGFAANGATIVVPEPNTQTSSAGSGPGPVAAPQKFDGAWAFSSELRAQARSPSAATPGWAAAGRNYFPLASSPSGTKSYSPIPASTRKIAERSPPLVTRCGRRDRTE
jgi:hypothetical protein